MSTIIWEAKGRMTLCEKGRPEFPAIQPIPGLYRLTLDNGWCYIGEARDLQHRLSEYRHPTTGVIMEHRIHEALKDAGGAFVETFTSGNLAEKTTRCSLEVDAIQAARGEGTKVLNGGRGFIHAYSLLLDIKYHEVQIEKLRKKLEAVSVEV
jgi:hypothetical protein